MNRKAQALISVFLLLIIAGIFVGVLGRLWPAEMQTRQYEKDGLKAFYLAHGALELGKTAAGKFPALSGWFPCKDDSDPNCWYRNFGDWYKVNITNLGGSRRKITARAREMDTASSSARILSQRKLEVTIDLGTRTEEAWSWREECPTCVSAPPPPSPPPSSPPPSSPPSCDNSWYPLPCGGLCSPGQRDHYCRYFPSGCSGGTGTCASIPEGTHQCFTDCSCCSGSLPCVPPNPCAP